MCFVNLAQRLSVTGIGRKSYDSGKDKTFFFLNTLKRQSNIEYCAPVNGRRNTSVVLENGNLYVKETGGFFITPNEQTYFAESPSNRRRSQTSTVAVKTTRPHGLSCTAVIDEDFSKITISLTVYRNR